MARNDIFNRFTAAVLIVTGAIAFSVYRTIDFSEGTVENAQPATSAKVKRVVSANKIETDNDDRVIMAGIRAPYPNEPGGPEAAELLRSLIEGKRIRIRFDDEGKKDKQGRWLGYVFIDGQMTNERLVHDGLAYVRLKTGQQRYRDQLLAAQRNARSARRGVWKSHRDDQGEYVGDRKHGTYHLRSCEDVPNIKPGDDVKLAGTGAAFEQGFAPCGHCGS